LFRALKPGGWIDHAEAGLFFVSDYDTLEDGHAYHQWGKLMSEAGEKARDELCHQVEDQRMTGRRRIHQRNGATSTVDYQPVV